MDAEARGGRGGIPVVFQISLECTPVIRMVFLIVAGKQDDVGVYGRL